MRTLLITDGSLGKGTSLFNKLKAACQEGIDAIQIREKQASLDALLAFAEQIRHMTWKYGVSLYINERADIALAVKADGVHLPEQAPFPCRLPLKIGRSVHSLEAAFKAEKEGVDYVLFGPVFLPLSKDSQGNPQGLAKLEQMTKQLKVPVIAIGGVTPDRVPLLLQSGAKGFASITALLHASDIKAAIAAFHAPFGQSKRKISGLYGIFSSVSIAQKAILGGVDCVQYRHKGLWTQKEIEIAREIKTHCKNAGIPFLINDRCDIALELEADGVHIGESDLPVPFVRQIIGPFKIIGATASDVELALKREKEGADYIGLGHIFPTLSKKKDYPPIGLGPIQEVKEKLKIPVIVIGGITENNALLPLSCGADGIAVISAISKSKNPLRATQRLRSMFL